MAGTPQQKQPWLHSFAFDTPFILLPGFLALLVTICLPDEYKTTSRMSVAGWVILVLCIDVAHVYSTLFRTYWLKERFAKHRTLYLVIPLLCYIAGVVVYTTSGLLFWRLLAYLAVYHFVRQQYGFMRMYSRNESREGWSAKIDTITIYAATLYPLVYWHCTPGRNFSWFVDGDFMTGSNTVIRKIAFCIYLLIIATYIFKEIRNLIATGTINIPKNAIVLGTALTWYFGIVYFNGDMAFTLLNVVAHGIPYIALIWLFGQREKGIKSTFSFTGRSVGYTLAFFVGSLLLFAYLEEGLWDGLVWREHGGVFSAFQMLPVIRSKELLALLVPLLSLPQSTHYVLDGFIWKRGHE